MEQNGKRNPWHRQEFGSHKIQTDVLSSLSKKRSQEEMSILALYQHMNHYYDFLYPVWRWTFLICFINPWLDSWECFMCARSASQGWGSSVWSSHRTKGLRFGSWVREGEITQWSLALPLETIKQTNEKFCGWLIWTEHAREDEVS